MFKLLYSPKLWQISLYKNFEVLNFGETSTKQIIVHNLENFGGLYLAIERQFAKVWHHQSLALYGIVNSPNFSLPKTMKRSIHQSFTPLESVYTHGNFRGVLIFIYLVGNVKWQKLYTFIASMMALLMALNYCSWTVRVVMITAVLYWRSWVKISKLQEKKKILWILFEACLANCNSRLSKYPQQTGHAGWEFLSNTVIFLLQQWPKIFRYTHMAAWVTQNRDTVVSTQVCM